MIRVGVLSPVTGGFYFGEVLAGIVDEVAAVGGRVALVQTLDAGQTGDELVPVPDVTVPTGWQHLDGFIAIAQAASAPYLHQLRAAGKPVVLVSNDEELDAARVIADNAGGVAAAVAHLVGHGHTRIGFAGNLAQSDMRERHAAYRDALRAHGLPLEESLFFSTCDHVEPGGRAVAPAVARAAAAAPGLTAVIAATDRTGLGLLEGLAAQGLSVPTDIAVIGFDDVEAGWHSSPPLATVNQQIMEQGALAGRLLLAELGGQQIDHGRHQVPARFLPRRSCGCVTSATDAADRGQRDGEALVRIITDHLDAAAADRAALTDVDMDALDGVIRQALARLYPLGPSPETLERFTETVLRLLSRQALEVSSVNPTSGALLESCMVRTLVVMAQMQAVTGMRRSERMSVSLAEQYDVGIGLLGQVDSDPSDLGWLRQVSVPLGCLGLWDGPAAGGRLRIAGVYDPSGSVAGQVPEECDVQSFPPKALLDQADASARQATFVIPLRGPSGDQGLLCVTGPVDTQAGTGRATYNHWAALLGAALKQQALLEAVRRSEERYSLVTAATDDGLWDWDVQARTCYYSERCQEMLGIDHDQATDPSLDPAVRTHAPELRSWLAAVHGEDLESVCQVLTRAAADLQPFEIEHRIAAPEGGHRWVLARGLPVGPPGGRARRVVGSLSDIHQRTQLEAQLRRAALYDTVTGLPNRRLFLERLERAVAQAQGPDETPFAVAFMDLDGFKSVNDTLGHPTGDELLAIIGARLDTDLRATDTAARFGGDEFAVLLSGLDHHAILAVVSRIQDRIAVPIVLAGREVTVTASVGIATSDAGYDDPEEVLRDADIAMYHAKGTATGTASVFGPSMQGESMQGESMQGESMQGDQLVRMPPSTGRHAPVT